MDHAAPPEVAFGEEAADLPRADDKREHTEGEQMAEIEGKGTAGRNQNPRDRRMTQCDMGGECP
jgi:hypothetical protein